MSWILLFFIAVKISDAFVVETKNETIFSREANSGFIKDVDTVSSVFNGVYTECFLYMSYSCIQKKTLLYLNELNKLSEVSVIGDYVKFVKVNDTDTEHTYEEASTTKSSEELSSLIDKAVNKFFNSHILKFSALGKDISTTNTVEEFVGRKRKGGGGGGGGGHHGGDDGGKKKMMMMAMMCMKMKLMMMVPAMMGMMGMMSFKGMMFSMMSFMVSKMMLLMKILEKKGGGGGGGGDGGWAAAGGGGGGAWMPAGGQDYGGGGGGGGGYDANGQWQSRSIAEARDKSDKQPIGSLPIDSYAPPMKYNNKIIKTEPYSVVKSLNDEVIKLNKIETKSRKKRGIVDVLQNAYFYWMNRMLGVTSNRRQNLQPQYPKYRIINGVKYVYYPLKLLQKVKTPKELNHQEIVQTASPIMIGEDFDKGEIVEGPVEPRMNKKKMQKLKNDINEVIEENPWE